MRFSAAALALLMGACATTDAMDPPPSGDPPPPPPSSGCAAADLVTPRCGPLSATSYLALADTPGQPHQVVVIDAATGTTCPVVTAYDEVAPIDGVTALAVMDQSVYYCATQAGHQTGNLTHVSLVDGATSAYTFECVSVTAYGGKLVVLRDPGTTLSLKDVVDVLAPDQQVTLPQLGDRLGYGDDKLYSTNASPDTVFVYDPATRASTSFHAASGALGVQGLAAHGGALTILDGVPDTQSLVSIDAATGEQIESVPVGQQAVRLHGLTNTCSGTAVFL